MDALANYHEFVGRLSNVEKTVCNDLLAWETRSAIVAERRAERIAEKLRRFFRRLRKARFG